MDQQQRHLAAILFTDVVGYTAMMQENEKQAVAAIKRHNSVLERIALAYHGQVVNYYGDGSLSIFQSATEAVQAAMELQSELQKAPIVPLRIGLHIGEIFFEDGKTLGDSVNLASRIQSLGQANTILFSGEIHNKITNHPEYKSVSLGLFDFKNVSKPIEVFALANEGLRVPKRAQMEGKLKHSANRLSPARKSMLTVMGLLLLIAVAFMYSRLTGKNKLSSQGKSVAVFAFQNMGNRDNDFVSEGITEDITTKLSKIAALRVYPITNAMRHSDSARTIKEIAEQKGASAILEGSVRISGNERKIHAQLTDANTGELIWSEDYDQKNANDIFSLQSNVAQSIASGLNTKLSVEEKSKIEKNPTTNPEALRFYWQGRYWWNQRGEKNLRKANQYFDSAIALDPLYSKAWSGKADCLSALGYGSFDSPKNTFPFAEAAANKALEYDSTLAEQHASLGYIKLYFHWDWNGAEKELKKAISLNPNYDIGHQWYGVYLTVMGRFEEAQKQLETAHQLDPLSPGISTDMGFNLVYKRNYDEAIESLKSTLKLNPNFPIAHLWLARAYQAKKMYKEALEENLLAQRGTPDWVPTLAAVGNIYGSLGEKAEAERILSRFNDMIAKKKYVTPYGIALVYTGLGNKDKAFEYLEKAYDDRANWLVWLNQDRRWDPLRSDKRFAELVSKIKLPVITYH